MKIYVLTETITQQSFSPMNVFTFFSKAEAHNKMIAQIYEHLNKAGFEVSMEELDNPNGYENTDIHVGYDYARDDASISLWEIFENEVFFNNAMISNVIAVLHTQYEFPDSYDSTLFELMKGDTEELINSYGGIQDYIGGRLIGETLYETAIENLGGKTDDESYNYICSYLNGNQFIKNHCNNGEWFYGMLKLCSGETEVIQKVREEIDEKLSCDQKVFSRERVEDFLLTHKYDLPKNHRELCSYLSDEQYLQIMEGIFSHKFSFGGSNDDLRVVIKNFYENARYALYKVIRAYGCNDILEKYSYVFEVVRKSDEKWELQILGDPCEIAEAIEDLKVTFDNLF